MLFLLLDFFLSFLLSRLSLLFGRTPTVQIVGYVMAVIALAELCHHACRVRNTVAVLTLRHHLVFLLMTESTGKGLVLGDTVRE